LRQLEAEHRRIERLLDELAQNFTPESFHAARDAALEHYGSESGVFAAAGPGFAAFTAKLEAQHAEVAEIAQELDRSLASGDARDVNSLCRRFRALAQHNIIEEERDLFPLLSADPAADYD
jgi:hypothetical protein